MSAYLPSIDDYIHAEPELTGDYSLKKNSFTVTHLPKLADEKENNQKTTEKQYFNNTTKLPQINEAAEDYYYSDFQYATQNQTFGFQQRVLPNADMSRRRALTTSRIKWECLGDYVRCRRKKSRSKRDPSKRDVVNRSESGSDRKFSKIKKLKDQRTPREVLSRFRRAIRQVMTIKRITDAITQKVATISLFSHLRDPTSDEASHSWLFDGSLYFDPSYFKAKRASINQDVRQILRIPVHLRTTEQINTVIYALRIFTMFSEYPLHLQEKLARVAWYERIPPRRVIIRQGHRAENFYFMLSGTALVTVMIQDPNTGEPVCRTAGVLKGGMSFGELALLRQCLRSATVTTFSTTELLSIGQSDFYEIYMTVHSQDLPEYINFLGTCKFIKDWPVYKLLEKPDMCMLHFFKRNALIIEDCNKSEWLYIVKTGRCQIMKRLAGVAPRRTPPKLQTKWDDGTKLSFIANGMINSKIECGKKRKKSPFPEYIPPPTPQSKGSSKDEDRLSEDKEEDAAEEKEGKESIMKFDDEEECDDELDDNEEDEEDADEPSDEELPEYREAVKEYEKETNEKERGNDQKQQRKLPVNSKAYFSACGKKCLKSGKPKTSREKSYPDVFTQVGILKPRDVFGLHTLKLDEDPTSTSTSMSLVSLGAECIMLSKDFFMQHADAEVRKQLCLFLRPYPTEEVFQETLQIDTDWRLYKQLLVEEIASRKYST